ncbi:MAG: pyridoxal phosphate-dependent aminotransferase [Burkholderiales bacterium]|jgi:aspartate/methionine/tyrosine aminotransferase|nr:pyridoxal phosphate-dependent aminotransferase [Burkholderiales bacterium]
MPSLATRTGAIASFYVMEVAKAAAELEAQGRSVIHMSIGEPDFTAPPAVQAAAADAIARGATQYTPALGLPALRAAIAGWYASFYGIEVDPQRVIVTAGASAALLLAFAALLERDGEVLMPDPSYPCNRHFAAAFDGRARLVPCGPETRFQLTPAMVRAHWTAATRGVLLDSPSNPTGTAIRTATLRELLATVRERAGFVVVDEIYQGLSYDGAPTTALALDDEAIVLNSFSKYFNMTGWRLGWLVAPASMVADLERLAQNLYICPSAVAQHAALACFATESIAIYEKRRAEFKRRRDYLLAELPGLGLRVPVAPDGAFYIYADVSALTDDSWEFAFRLLRDTGVCLVPGRDFGTAEPQRWVRISYATSLERLREAVARMRAYLRPGQASGAALGLASAG